MLSNTGWKEGPLEYAHYDDSGNLQIWASYSMSNLASTSGSASTIDLQIGSSAPSTYTFNMDGDFTTSSVDYNATIQAFFSNYRLVFRDNGDGTPYSANELIVIPSSKFDDMHDCDTVLVDPFEWFQGTFFLAPEAAQRYDVCSNGHGQWQFCIDAYGTCMNNTLSNWLTWGQLGRDDIAFPGFSLLNLGGLNFGNRKYLIKSLTS